MNKFLKIRDQNLKEFSHRTESYQYSFFSFFVNKSNSLEKCMREAKSIMPFRSNVNAVFHIIFMLFLIHEQIGAKLRGYGYSLVT